MADKAPSTYHRYKSSTNVFLTWLIEHGKEHGWRPPTAAQDTGRKKSQVKFEYTLKLKDYRDCAETIAASAVGVPQIPDVIRQAARDALRLRKRFSNWFARQATATTDAEALNTSHRYFNTWLEDILKLLGQPSDEEGNVTSGESEEFGTGGSAETFSNRFSVLEVEESRTAEDSADVRQQPSSSPLKISAVELDVPDDVSNEAFMATCCLYQDFNAMRKAISQLWQDYGRGKKDLASVSIATNAAFEMALSMEAEILETFPEFRDCRKMLTMVVQKLNEVREACFGSFGRQGNNILVPKLFLDWTCYHVTHKCCLLDLEQKEHLQTLALMQEDDIIDQNYNRYITEQATPDETVPLRWHRRFRYLHADIEVLETVNIGYLMEDHLTKLIRKRKKLSVASPASVFMHQILADIWTIFDSSDHWMGDLHNFRNFVGALAARAEKDKEVGDNGVELQMAEIKRDFDVDKVAAIFQKIVSLPAKTRQSQALFRANPILCGLVLFSHQQKWHQIGLQYLNKSACTVGCVHLYNAIQQTRLMNIQWRDLEHLLKMHDVNQFFIGEKPQLFHEMMKQWWIVNGVSPRLFSKESQAFLEMNPQEGLRLAHKKSSYKKRRVRTSPLLLSNAIYRNYYATSRWGLTQPDLLLALDRRLFPLSSERRNEDARKPSKGFKFLSLADQISSIAEAFSGEERSHRLFDYYRLHKRCSEFLRSLVPLLSCEAQAYLATEQNLDASSSVVSDIFEREVFNIFVNTGLTTVMNEPSTIVLKDVAKRMQDLIDEKGNWEITMMKLRAKNKAAKGDIKPVRVFELSSTDIINLPSELKRPVWIDASDFDE